MRDVQTPCRLVRSRSLSYSPNGAKGVQALGSRPGQSLLLSRVLHVASGHVNREGVASDVVRGLRGRDVPSVLADDDTELDLVVRDNTLRDLDRATGGQVRRGRLEEEEGLYWLAT